MTEIVKISGDCVNRPETIDYVKQLGEDSFVVVGAGSEINRQLGYKGIVIEFKDGKRVTPASAIPIIRECLELSALGLAHQMGVAVVDGLEVLKARRLEGWGETGVPVELVGEFRGPTVLTPMGRDSEWKRLNCNADDVAWFLKAQFPDSSLTVFTKAGRQKEADRVVYCA